mgnify:CR=1 FL=1
MSHFYPRPPWGGRHIIIKDNNKTDKISIHALRGEDDINPKYTRDGNLRFLSTPSVGRTTKQLGDPRPNRGISIHALRGEDDVAGALGGYFVGKFLSTPSVGRTTSNCLRSCFRFRISIHALRGEDDPTTKRQPIARGYFYPRPPWGGRRNTFK